jgi:hypothetical protein
MLLPIYFSSNPSNVNKNMINYFKHNLETLNKIGLVFDFNVAHKEDADKYKKLKIDDFPTLISNNKHVVGTDEISKHLKEFIIKHNQKKILKTDSDELADYWKTTIGNVKIKDGKIENEDEEESEDINDELQKNIQDAVRKRASSAKASPFRPNSRSSESTSVRNQKSKITPSGGIQKAYNNKATMSKSHNQPTNRKSGKNNSPTPSETLKKMSSPGGESSLDDQLMANFFENQEATEI